MMETPVSPRRPYWTWERLARIAIFTQVAITVLIAVYFAVVTDKQNTVLANQAITSAASNAAIITEIRDDVDTHARASADRTCGVAHLLQYLVNAGTTARSPFDESRIQRYVDRACLFVPPNRVT